MNDENRIFQEENDQRQREDTLDMLAEMNDAETREKRAAMDNLHKVVDELEDKRWQEQDKALAEEVLRYFLLCVERGKSTAGDAETAREALRVLGVNV